MRYSVTSVLVGLLMITTLLTPVTVVGSAEASPTTDATSVDLSFMNYIHINGMKFDPLQGLPTMPLGLENAPSTDSVSYYIVQLRGPVTPVMRESVQDAGANLLHYISYNAYVVRADQATLQRLESIHAVRWIGAFEPAYKISGRLSPEHDAVLEAALGRAVSETAAYASSLIKFSSSPQAKAVDPYTGAAVDSYLASDRAALKKAHEMISAAVRGPLIDIEIVAFERSQVLSVAEELEKLGAKDIRYSFETSGKLRAKVDRAIIPEIARMSGVMWIDRYVQPFIYNDIARWVIQSNDDISYSTPIHDHGIWGTNQTVTVCDSGLDYEHDAFEDIYGNNTPNPSHRKVTDYYVPPGGGGDYSDNGINHGTHVSGTVAGDDGTWHAYDGDPWGSTGTLGPHDGHAFDAKIQMQDLSPDGYYVYPPDDYAVLYQNALDRGSYIHTNSWGGPEYYYVQECADTDEFVWMNQDFTILFAAGNPGSGLGWISSYASAKNVIGVGATLNGASREDVASFSGRGPCSDGRLKPDVMTPGVNTWSARGGDPGGVYDDYFQLSGTSMATPACAGAVTLIRQYYMDGWYPTGSRQPANGFVPSAALIKATLINSATEMSGSGAYINGETRYPNYNQGWGRVVLDDALWFEGETRGLIVDDNRAGLNTGQSSNYSLAIGDSSKPLEITLVWTDYPGTPMSTPNLVNDLDLTVIAPDGTVYRGNMYQGYNPGESIPDASDSDRINNVESVLVLSPQTGLWTVTVDAFNVPWGPQSYAIVMTGGIATERGAISLDSEEYRSDATVQISVVDTGLNLDTGSADLANVTIWSDTEPSGEEIVLWETAPSSSVFMGFVSLEASASPVPGDGYLQTKHGDMIVAAYYDDDNGLGGSGYVYDYAEVDDMPPAIFDVGVVNLRFNRATIVWSTDEESTSAVIWGTTVPPTNLQSHSRRVLNHSVSLTGLIGNTTYCFAVQSTDLAGNTATDDNGSSYFWFTTPERPELPGSSPEWPMYHNNPARQGISPALMSPPLQLMWSDGPYLEELWTSPVYSDGVLVSTTLDGAIRARDPYTGEVLWARTLGGQYYYTCSPTVEGGVVYASFYKGTPAGEEGRLYALDLKTGDTIWSIGPETGLDISARTALVHDSGLLFGCSWSGEIFAVDMTDGSVEWRYQTGDISIAGAAVGLGLVFVTLYNSYAVVAIDQYSGGLVWQSALDDLSVGPALVAQDCVYVGTESGTMYCFDAATGVLEWVTSGLSPIDFGTPAYDGTNIYFGTLGGNVWALDASNGSIQWVTTAGSAIGSSLAYVDGYLYFACQDGLLYVVDSANGYIVETHSIGALSVSSPATAEGWVWVENYEGAIFGFMGKIPVGLFVSPVKQQKDVVPSCAVDFELMVTNIGVSGPDTFDISLMPGAMGWDVELFEDDGVSPLTDTDGDGVVDTGSLATYEKKMMIARMTIPPDAEMGDEETSALTFSSSNDLGVTKTVFITATVPPPGVWIGPRQFFPLNPGDIASATLEVRNKGAMPDTIDLTISDELSWPTALYESDGVTPLSDHDGDGVPDTDVISGLGSSTLVVEVQVPFDAKMGSANRVRVTGTSSLDTNASGSGEIVVELAAPPNDEWPMFHNDVSRRGEWPGAMSPPLELRWIDRNCSDVGVWYVSPAYADGRLFTTNADGYLRAYDAFSGELMWAKEMGMDYYYTTSPNVYDGMVITSFYTSTSGGTMFAFDEFTGETLWSFGPGSGFDLAARTEKLVIDGLAFGTAWSGEIFALDAYTGALVWSTNVGMTPIGGLAAGAGALFCPMDEGYLVAVDQQTGAYLWSSPLDYAAAVTPVYGGGCVYVGTLTGTMYAIDAATGEVLWSTGGLGGFWFSSPAYHNGILYFGTDAARYYAMDASDGSIVWSTSALDWVECGPVYANGYLYFTEWDGQLRVLDAEDGSLVETHYLENYVECSPAAADGWIWVQDSYGNLYAFEGLQPVGIRIQPSTAHISACPGTQVDIAIDVINSGSLPTDTFDLYASAGPLGWDTVLLSSDGFTPLSDTDGDGITDTGPVASGEATMVIARVAVPPSASTGDADTLTIDFVSSNDPSVSRTGTYTTEVPPPGVDIGPDASECAKPGDYVEKMMTVKNTGGFPDTIDIEAQSDHGWSVSLLAADATTPLSDTDGDGVPDVGLLGGLESTSMIVRIEVPWVAPLGTSDIITITGRSSVNPTACDSATIRIELSPEPEAWWPTYQNNAARQGRSSSMVTPPLSVEWLTGGVSMDWVSLIADDGLLFAIAYDEMNATRSIVLAFDAYSGSCVWQTNMGGVATYIDGTPVAYNGIVYVTYRDYFYSEGWLVALEEHTGEQVWRLGQEDGVDVDPSLDIAASDGMVFASTTDGKAFAADARTGDLLWQTPSFGANVAGITVVGGVVYVVYGSYGTPCAAFDQATGTMIWYATTGMGWATGPGTYARGSLFVSTQDGYVVSLNAADGTVRWVSEYLGWMYWTCPAYDGERLYVGGAYTMNALDVDTGELIWRYYTPGYCEVAPVAVASGYVYCADTAGYLIVLDAATGTYAWYWYLGSPLYSCPVISEEFLWIATSQGELWAFRGEILAGMAISPTYQEEMALPYDTIDYEIQVKNLGTLPYDTIDVTATSGPYGWMVELLSEDHATPLEDTDSDGIPDTGPIAHNETVSIVVRITVPAEVYPGDEELTVATFTSSNDPTVSRRARMVSIVPPPGGAIGPRQFFSVAPDTNVTATLRVENLGPLPDTFDMSAQSESGWRTELLGEDGATPLADTDGDGLPDTGELASRGAATVIVRIYVPPEAHTGLLDVTCVSATSSIDISRTVSTMVLVEIAGPPSEDWPTVLHDNARTGVAPEAFDLPLSPLWSTEVSSYPINWYGAVISDGVVYFTDESVGVGALDLDTGEQVWYRELVDALEYFVGPPTVAYGCVYVAADVPNGVEMYCLDASTGGTVWRSGTYRGDWSTYTIPVVASGMVLWSVYGEGWVYANDALTGELLWSFMMPSWCSDGPTYWQGMVFVADEWGNVAAFDAVKGDIIWWSSVPEGYTVWSIASVADGMLLVADQGGYVTAFDAVTGEVVWRSPNLGPPIYASTPILAEGLVLIPNGEAMFALDATDGSIVWSCATSTTFTTAGAYNNGTVFAMGDDFKLYAWEVQTGNLVMAMDIGARNIPGPIAISNGYMVVGDRSGQVICLGFDGVGIPARIVLSPSSTDLGVGGAALFTAKLCDRYFNELSGYTYTWSSVNGLGTVLPISSSGDTVVYVAGPVAGADTLIVSAAGYEASAQISISPGAAQSVEIVPSDVVVTVGGSVQFTAVVRDAYGNVIPDAMIDWSADAWIGSIDASGLFTASTISGSGAVRATCGLLVGSATVRVSPGPLASIAVSPPSVSAQAGSTIVLGAKGYDQYGNEISGLTFSWSTSIGSVAPSTPDGAYAILSVGTVAGTGLVTVQSGTVTLDVPVTVTAAPVSTIVIAPSSASIVVGTVQAFTATPLDMYGNVVTGVALVWSTSGAIGSISQEGVLTAAATVSSGMVMVTSGGLSASAHVDLLPGPLTSLVATPSSVSAQVGTTVILSVKGYDQYGNEIPGLTFSWYATIGSVSPSSTNGDHASFGAGTATGSGSVTVSAGGLSLEIPAVVTPGPVARILLAPTAVSLQPGATQTFSATPVDIFGNSVLGVTVVWSVSGSIGTVTQTGLLTAAELTSTGSVTATVGSVSASATVEIVPGPLASILLEPSDTSAVVGTVVTVTATGLDAHGNSLEGVTYEWACTGTSYVRSYPSWIVVTLPKVVGAVTVTASNGSVSASVTITAVAGDIQAITLSPSTGSVAAGGTLSFSAQARDIYGNVISGAEISWSTSTGSITQTGVLTAPTAVGVVVVTAASGDVSASATVTIVPAGLHHITVTPPTITLQTGGGANLQIMAYDQYGNEIHGLAMNWTTTIGSLDVSVDGYSAAFSTGERAGSGTITVNCGDKSATVEVTISEASLPMGRQLAQPLSIGFLALAVMLAILLLYNLLRRRGKGGTPESSGPESHE